MGRIALRRETYCHPFSYSVRKRPLIVNQELSYLKIVAPPLHSPLRDSVLGLTNWAADPGCISRPGHGMDSHLPVVDK